MTFAVGSLVQARGREWIVLPESQGRHDLLVVRPLVGSDDEVTGIYLPLEPVEPARFGLPDPAGDLGNHRSGALLREAVRLGFRSAAGPFRALGAIAVEPRPYQLVPLLMALRLDPVRLLVADDVGVGKSIEAALVLRELLDRGEIESSVVLAPPHLAEQWHRLLVDQFHVDAVLLLPGTAARLDRQAGLGPHRSVFDHFPHVVVSMDYIKQERRRYELLRAKPDLVIVDEAHTCAAHGPLGGDRGGRHGLGRAAHRRHELLADLAADASRHLLLVTATPHSGNEEAFRSLLALLEPDFAELPADLGGDANRPQRERLARHFVQRRRGDLAGYLGATTPFPKREEAQEHYSLTPAYHRFFERVLDYCRETVTATDDNPHRRRVRWWSALALLRALSSSPEAAASTLRNRAAAADTETVEEADDVGRRTVFDQDDEMLEGNDVVPGSLIEDEGDDGDAGRDRRRLQRMARDVLELAGPDDAKLARAAALVRQFLDDGFAPIVFCRFIPTVAYVAAELRRRYGSDVTVEAVTGQLPPEERERRVAALGHSPRRVLVCTDCLSEGINLQEHFDAVLHYDLSWNPTRHEQREGRVDRYGQPQKVVRTVTLHGENNPVDGIVLQVLLEKHRKIRDTLGITVPVPMDTNAVVEAIFEGLLMREHAGSKQLSFEFLREQQRELDAQWDAAAERERKSRTVFAQHGLRFDDAVRLELDAARHAIGDAAAVERFVRESLAAYGAAVGERRGAMTVELESAPREVREALVPAGEKPGTLRAVFAPPAPSGAEVLTRAHPLVTALAERVWAQALSTQPGDAPARRCAVVRTAAVDRRTTLLLLRLRFHIVTRRRGEERPLLAEEAQLAAFRGSPHDAEWLPPDDVEALLAATPSGNVPADAARHHLARVVDRFDAVRPHLDEIAAARGHELLDAHRRVRQVTREGLRSLRVEPLPPVDVLGLFVYLPDVAEAMA